MNNRKKRDTIYKIINKYLILHKKTITILYSYFIYIIYNFILYKTVWGRATVVRLGQ